MTWNSTLRSGKPLTRKTPLRQGKPLKSNQNAISRYGSKARGATAAEKRFLDAIASQGCILCRTLGYPGTPAEIHHLRTGMGAGQRNTNENVIPLCPEHHRGATGYHGLGRRAFERMYGLTELDLLRKAWEVMDAGRAERISRHDWSTADEIEYHTGIRPIADALHPEAEVV